MLERPLSALAPRAPSKQQMALDLRAPLCEAQSEQSSGSARRISPIYPSPRDVDQPFQNRISASPHPASPRRKLSSSFFTLRGTELFAEIKLLQRKGSGRAEEKANKPKRQKEKSAKSAGLSQGRRGETCAWALPSGVGGETRT